MMMLNIGMITYNHEKFIAEAIESVLMQQTDFQIELVIGEDCSKDSTRAICKEYADRYPDIIKLLPSDKNLGLLANFTRTINYCRGKYIAVFSGDDVWIDEYKLQKQVDFLETHDDYASCFTGFIEKNESTKIEKTKIPEPVTTIEDLIKKCRFCAATNVFVAQYFKPV